MMRAPLMGGFLPAMLFLFPAPVSPQNPDSLLVAQVEQTLPDTLAQPGDSIARISPGGAFLRSALIPGWGHAKIGAPGRGVFYFAVESANVFMVLGARSRLNIARERLALRESVVTGRLRAQGIEDPGELEAALAEDEEVADLRGLEEARSGQREDWVALGIFFLFLGGADAFVSAHLADFPAPVEVQVEGTPMGRLEIGLSIPVGY
jgi:hypothetical protein